MHQHGTLVVMVAALALTAGCQRGIKPVKFDVTVEPNGVHRVDVEAMSVRRHASFSNFKAQRLEFFLVRAEKAAEVEKLLLDGGKPQAGVCDEQQVFDSSATAGGASLMHDVGYALIFRNTSSQAVTVTIAIGP